MNPDTPTVGGGSRYAIGECAYPHFGLVARAICVDPLGYVLVLATAKACVDKRRVVVVDVRDDRDVADVVACRYRRSPAHRIGPTHPEARQRPHVHGGERHAHRSGDSPEVVQ
jgi:hypothetical protein